MMKLFAMLALCLVPFYVSGCGSDDASGSGALEFTISEATNSAINGTYSFDKVLCFDYTGSTGAIKGYSALYYKSGTSVTPALLITSRNGVPPVGAAVPTGDYLNYGLEFQPTVGVTYATQANLTLTSTDVTNKWLGTAVVSNNGLLTYTTTSATAKISPTTFKINCPCMAKYDMSNSSACAGVQDVQ